MHAAPLQPSEERAWSAAGVARRFLALGAGEVGARLLAFVGMVHVARAVGPTSFGAIGFALAVMLYLSRFADSGLDQGVGVQEVATRRSTLGRLVPAVLTFRALLAVGVAACTASIALIVLPAPDGPVLALYTIVLIPLGLSTRWVHVGLDRGSSVAAARLLAEGTAVALLFALVHGPQHVLLAPVAQLTGETLAALLLLALLRRLHLPLRPRFDPAIALPVLRRGWRLAGASLLGLAIYNSDLLFLRVLRGATSVGHYVAAYALVSFCINIGITFALSVLPAVSALGGEGAKRHALYERSLSHAFAVVAPVVVGGAIVAPALVALLFGDGYQPAGAALRILIWSVLPAVLCEVANSALVATRHEASVMRVFAGTLLLTLLLNLALIPKFGITGAAVATIGAETARLLLALHAVRRAGFAPIRPLRWWRPAVAGAIMAALLLALRSAPMPATITMGAAAYVIGLTLVGGIRFRRGALPVLSV